MYLSLSIYIYIYTYTRECPKVSADSTSVSSSYSRTALSLNGELLMTRLTTPTKTRMATKRHACDRTMLWGRLGASWKSRDKRPARFATTREQNTNK